MADVPRAEDAAEAARRSAGSARRALRAGTGTVSGRNRAVKVSFDRPYSCSGSADLTAPDWSWEPYFIRWMERNGYDVSYTTSVDVHADEW